MVGKALFKGESWGQSKWAVEFAHEVIRRVSLTKKAYGKTWLVIEAEDEEAEDGERGVCSLSLDEISLPVITVVRVCARAETKHVIPVMNLVAQLRSLSRGETELQPTTQGELLKTMSRFPTSLTQIQTSREKRKIQTKKEKRKRAPRRPSLFG